MHYLTPAASTCTIHLSCSPQVDVPHMYWEMYWQMYSTCTGCACRLPCTGTLIYINEHPRRCVTTVTPRSAGARTPGGSTNAPGSAQLPPRRRILPQSAASLQRRRSPGAPLQGPDTESSGRLEVEITCNDIGAIVSAIQWRQ
jgi:hypothetical protein